MRLSEAERLPGTSRYAAIVALPNGTKSGSRVTLP